MREWLIKKRGNASQESISKKVGISRGAYANIELGRRNPSVQLAKKIADVLNFDWTLFFEDNSVETKQKVNSA